MLEITFFGPLDYGNSKFLSGLKGIFNVWCQQSHLVLGTRSTEIRPFLSEGSGLMIGLIWLRIRHSIILYGIGIREMGR